MRSPLCSRCFPCSPATSLPESYDQPRQGRRSSNVDHEVGRRREPRVGVRLRDFADERYRKGRSDRISNRMRTAGSGNGDSKRCEQERVAQNVTKRHGSRGEWDPRHPVPVRMINKTSAPRVKCDDNERRREHDARDLTQISEHVRLMGGIALPGRFFARTPPSSMDARTSCAVASLNKSTL